MIRKFLCCSALVPLFVVGVATRAQSGAPQAQSKPQTDQAKQVSGKVTNIGSDKRSFSLEVNDKGSKQLMQFVVDGNTQVQGRVTVGTDAVVQYQPTSDGKLVALSIAPQGGQGGQGGPGAQ
jgi:hypothetical protein